MLPIEILRNWSKQFESYLQLKKIEEVIEIHEYFVIFSLSIKKSKPLYFWQY